jgi:hypothetical protein
MPTVKYLLRHKNSVNKWIFSGDYHRLSVKITVSFCVKRKAVVVSLHFRKGNNNNIKVIHGIIEYYFSENKNGMMVACP